MKTAPLHFLAIGTFVVLALGPACKTGRVDPQTAAATAVASALGQDVKSVVRDKAPLYESGPEQMTLPEAMLEKNALVRVIRPEFGYCLVETQSGKLGWVANEDLADLTASTTE